jgi:hypothetical protein
MLPKERDPAERRLVEEFLAGKPEALKELQRRLLQRAPSAIRRARKSVKRYVPEDIAAAVLGYLYEHKEKVQAFLHGTKHLDALLDYHLWYAIKRQAEKDERQWAKRVPVPEAHVPDESLGHLPDELMEELYRLATPKERELNSDNYLSPRATIMLPH